MGAPATVVAVQVSTSTSRPIIPLLELEVPHPTTDRYRVPEYSLIQC